MTRVVRSPLPPNSEGFWLLKGEQITASVVVSPQGRNLRLSMFRGDPRQDWRALAAEYFPEAETVSFQRLEKDGFRERPVLRLKSAPLPVADPRWYLTDPDVWGWALAMIGGALLILAGVACWANGLPPLFTTNWRLDR